MIVKRDGDTIVIDFKNDIIHTYNETALTLHSGDGKVDGEKLEIANLHIVGSYSYSQLGFIDKVKLLYKVFKTIFLQTKGKSHKENENDGV